MKIGHISDMHFCKKHLDEVFRCVSFAISKFIEAEVDAIVISGDSTDGRLDLHSQATDKLITQVERAASYCPVLILHGTASHEPPGTLEIFKTMARGLPICVADTICQVGLARTSDGGKPKWIKSEGWKLSLPWEGVACFFSCLPSVNKAAVAALYGAEHAPEKAAELIQKLMEGWAETHLDEREAGVPTVLVSHGTVTGCLTEHGVPMLGSDHEFTTRGLFDSQASAVMLGHIHQMQSWSHEGRTIAYPGSTGRLHFGEEADKGVLIWDVKPDCATHEFIRTPAKKLLEIEYDGPPNMGELKERARAADNAHVRVRYSIDEEHRHSVDRKEIETIFLNEGAKECKVEGHINPIVRTRSQGINNAVSVEERLKVWCEVTNTEPAPLVERLHELLKAA